MALNRYVPSLPVKMKSVLYISSVKKRRESKNFFQKWPHMSAMYSYEASWLTDTNHVNGHNVGSHGASSLWPRSVPWAGDGSQLVFVIASISKWFLSKLWPVPRSPATLARGMQEKPKLREIPCF